MTGSPAVRAAAMSGTSRSSTIRQNSRSQIEWTSSLDRPYPYRADDGRENLSTPGERIVRGGNYIFDDTPDKLVSWNRSVAYRNPATGHRQIGWRCASS